jgi:hypothetical protein
MAYTVPQFNLLCDIWNAGHVPSVDDPDAENVPCQFYLYSRGTFDVQPCELELYTPTIWIRLPIGETANFVSGQVFECPAESGRYYRARFKERMHQGFPNEYLIVVVVQCTEDGVPMIRDIENAEPCGEPPGPEGEGEATLTITLNADGEGEVSSAPPDFVGEGTNFLIANLDSSFASSGTVT